MATRRSTADAPRCMIGVGSAVLCCLLALVARRDRRLLRRRRPTAILSRIDGPHLGVPGLPARDLARDRAADDRPAACSSGSSTSPVDSLWMPTLIIAIVYVPYVYRPVRGARCSSVREKEYVEAAIAQGASNWRLMFSEILPNVITDRDRAAAADDRHDGPDRGGALVPLDRRAAADRRAGERSSTTASGCSTRDRGSRSRPGS